MADHAQDKGIETLSNILALVLGDRPGEAAAALEAVRRKARRDGVTGGTLKQLMRQVARQERDRPAAAPNETERRLQRALQDNATLRAWLDRAEHALALRAERKTLGGLERYFRHADRLELDLRRRTFDLQALHEDMTRQHRQAEHRARTERRARTRNRLGLALVAMALALAADATERAPMPRPAGTSARPPPSRPGPAILAL